MQSAGGLKGGWCKGVVVGLGLLAWGWAPWAVAQEPVSSVSAEGQGQRPLVEELKRLKERIDQIERRLTVAGYRLPAQIELAGEAVPLQLREVRERLEREFYTILSDEPRVILWLKRAARYFPFIEQQLRDRNLPADLKYVAVVESDLNARAHSWAGADGYWQFIPATGRRYDLRQTAAVDERRNLEKATSGALRYLRDLYDRFHNWSLAMAAYNVGENRVEQELRFQGVDSYYQLELPRETERYVMRIIVAKLILSNPERYGFYLSREELYAPLEYDTVTVRVGKKRLSLQTVARASGSYFKEIRELNPELPQAILPPGEYQIRLPLGSRERFLAQYREGETGGGAVAMERGSSEGSNRADRKAQRIIYRVKKGDTLWSIASRFNVYVESIRNWNDLEERRHIAPGDRLVIIRP